MGESGAGGWGGVEDARNGKQGENGVERESRQVEKSKGGYAVDLIVKVCKYEQKGERGVGIRRE